jgi:hypothetical protein
VDPGVVGPLFATFPGTCGENFIKRVDGVAGEA